MTPPVTSRGLPVRRVLLGVLVAVALGVGLWIAIRPAVAEPGAARVGGPRSNRSAEALEHMVTCAVVDGLVGLVLVSINGFLPAPVRRPGVGAPVPAPWASPRNAPSPPRVPGAPLDLRPGRLAVLHAGRAETDAVVATLLDLAARGLLTVEEQPDTGWALVRARPRPTPREPRPAYEHTLLRAVFRNGERVAVEDLRAVLGSDLGRVQDQLLDDGAARGWFRQEAVAARRWWRRVDRIGWLLSLAAGVFAVVPVLRPTPADALSVLGFLLAAVGTVVLRRVGGRLARRRLPRSAAGDAALTDTNAFRSGLAAARDERWGRTPRAGDVYSPSLPYAVALGMAQPWSDLFAGLRRSGFTWVVAAPAPDPGARG